MTTYKRFTYDSLKSVLRHMDPNLRFQISDRMPSIRVAEKCTPLYINSLKLTSNEIEIDETAYCVEVIRQFEDCNIPERVQEIYSMNAKSKQEFVSFSHDLTPYGRRDYTTEDKMTPGDLVIEPYYKELEKEKEDLAREEQSLFERMMLQVVDHARQPDRQDQEAIEERRLVLEEYKCGYPTYLQFTVKAPSGNGNTTQIENMAYNKKIPQAMKYLSEKLLGGRYWALRVDLLNVSAKGGIFRLPEDLMLKVRHIAIGHNAKAILDPLKSLFHEDSFPVKRVFILSGPKFGKPENYKHPMIQAAEDLQIRGSHDQIQWLPMLLEFSVPFVWFECTKVPKIVFAIFLDSCLKDGREIGTEIAFGLDDENYKEELMDFAMNLPNAVVEEVLLLGCPTFQNMVIIPMKNNLELCVYSYEEDKDLEYNDRWGLNVAVIAANHQQLWNVDFLDDCFD